MGVREQPVPWALLAMGVVTFVLGATGIVAPRTGHFSCLALLTLSTLYALRAMRGAAPSPRDESGREAPSRVESRREPAEPREHALGTLGTLTAGIAHELNNPLTYLEIDLKEAEELLAQDDLSPNHDRRRRAGQLLHEALEATETMRRTVRSLQVFARSRPVDEHASTSLSECLRGAVSITRAELDRRADVEVALDECPAVAVPPAELTQLLVNLIRNAGARFDEHKRGRLRMTGCVEGEMVLVTIADDGPGMPPDMANHAFAPFVSLRPEQAKTLAGSDVGLRLAVCYGIVSSAGGRIALESGARGTTVNVWLPTADESLDAGRASPAVQSGAMTPRRFRLVLIDDDRRVARALKRALKPHNVVAFSGGEAALAWLAEDEQRADAIDAVICDVMMPGLTGPDVHRRLDEMLPALARRMIFITGGITSREHRAFFAEHQLDCLDKPVDLEVLDRRITEMAPPRRQSFIDREGRPEAACGHGRREG